MDAREGRSAPASAPPAGGRPIGAAVALCAVLALALTACGRNPAATAPNAPTDVTATAIAGGVRVAWTADGVNTTSFLIARSTSEEPAEPGDGFEIVGEADPQARAFEDLTTLPDTAYRYRVSARGPAGDSDPSAQSGSPVTPLPAITLRITIAGEGRVAVEDGTTTRVCENDCSLPYAVGAELKLSATGLADQVFAGWNGACGAATECVLRLTGDTTVGVSFARVALTLTLSGDAAATVTISPGQGGFDTETCVLDPGAACIVGYPDAGYEVSVSVRPAELEGSVTPPLLGCDSQIDGRYCLVKPPQGSTRVVATVLHPPTAANDAYNSAEDVPVIVEQADGVLANDRDTVGDTLTAVLEEAPLHGTLTLASDGSFRYTPHTDVNGLDAFRYHARDAYGNESASVTVRLNVAPVNDAPVFELRSDPPDTKDGAYVPPLSAFAFDIGPGGGSDEAGQSLRFALATKVTPGDTLRFDDPPTIDAGGTLRYTPAVSTYGSATITATLIDDGGSANGGENSSDRSFRITVLPLRLTLKAEGGGRLSPDPTPIRGGYAYGSPVTITAEAGDKERFLGWEGACASVKAKEASCTLRLTADTTVIGIFEQVATLTVVIDAAEPAWYGSVTSDPKGIDCPNKGSDDDGDTCAVDFPVGTTVTLAAQSLPWLTEFTGWSGAGCRGTDPCTLVLTGDAKVTASFRAVGDP